LGWFSSEPALPASAAMRMLATWQHTGNGGHRCALATARRESRRTFSCRKIAFISVASMNSLEPELAGLAAAA
jgi:hypothetical protein